MQRSRVCMSAHLELERESGMGDVADFVLAGEMIASVVFFVMKTCSSSIVSSPTAEFR